MSEEEMVGQEDDHPVPYELTFENKTTLQNLS